jgi:hypothetical protein
MRVMFASAFPPDVSLPPYRGVEFRLNEKVRVTGALERAYREAKRKQDPKAWDILMLVEYGTNAVKKIVLGPAATTLRAIFEASASITDTMGGNRRGEPLITNMVRDVLDDQTFEPYTVQLVDPPERSAQQESHDEAVLHALFHGKGLEDDDKPEKTT